MAPLLDTPIVPLTTLPVQPDSPITPLEETPIVLVSNNVILPNRVQTAGTIVISPTTGKIINVLSEIVPAERFPPGTEYTDYSPKFLMPGLVDAHVHLNEPGWRTEWEGFDTGTKAAAFGGVTTVIDMPLNAIPPTTTIENFNEKLKAADNACWVDVGFYGGVIPGNEEELLPLVKAGVRGFKCFLIESGVRFPIPLLAKLLKLETDELNPG
jgi:allantoinase